MYAISDTKPFHDCLWQLFYGFIPLYGFAFNYCIFVQNLKDAICFEVLASIFCTSNFSIWDRSIFKVIYSLRDLPVFDV